MDIKGVEEVARQLCAMWRRMETSMNARRGTFFGRAGVLCALSLLMAGCATSDLCLFNPTSGEMRELPHGRGRQIVVEVSEAGKEFMTLSRLGGNAGIRIFDFDGEEKRRAPCPPFLMDYRISDPLAVQGMGRLIAYRKHGTRDLYVFDASKNTEEMVYRDLGSKYDSAAGVEWLPDGKLLLLLNADSDVGRRQASIEVLDIASKTCKRIFQPSCISAIHPYSLSNRKNKLAFCDGEDDSVCVRVLDLESATVVAQSQVGPFFSVCWSPSDEYVGFFDSGRWIKRLRVSRGTIETLDTGAKEWECLHLMFGDSFYAYSWITREPKYGSIKKEEVVVCDWQSGSRLRTVSMPVNGAWHSVSGGQKVVCEIGY